MVSNKVIHNLSMNFRLLLKRCPPHGFDILEQMQIFTHGMHVQTRMLLDASVGGSIREKNRP